MRHRTTTVTALLIAVLALLLAPPAQAASPSPAPVTEASVQAHLKGTSLTRWKGLSHRQKATTLAILSDPGFGLPSQAARLDASYPELQITELASSELAATTTSYTSRTSWVRQNWTIFGVVYTELKTSMSYYTYGSVVKSVYRCVNSYVNWVTATRQITGDSWYTLGNGLADCWTYWEMARPFQSTETGYQGLRVNGYGTILKIWYV